MANPQTEPVLEFPSDEALGRMLVEAGNLMTDSGRKAMARDWSGAAMTSMRANQIAARAIKAFALREKVQAAAHAKTRVALASVENERDTAVAALNLTSNQAVDWKLQIEKLTSSKNVGPIHDDTVVGALGDALAEVGDTSDSYDADAAAIIKTLRGRGIELVKVR